MQQKKISLDSPISIQGDLLDAQGGWMTSILWQYLQLLQVEAFHWYPKNSGNK